MGIGSGAPGGHAGPLPETRSAGASGFQGLVSPYYHTGGRKQEPSTKSVFILMLVLRIASLLLALISVVLIASAEGERYYVQYSSFAYYSYKSLRTRPSRFIVAMSGIVILYELVLSVLGCLERTHYIDLVKHTSTFIIFGFDQVLSYLMFAAATAGATYSALEKYGDGTVEGDCSRGFFWHRYCTQEAAAVSMAYLSFGALAILALLSASKFFKHRDTLWQQLVSLVGARVGIWCYPLVILSTLIPHVTTLLE